MTDYKIVALADRSELKPGGHYREYKRAEVMIGELGPFVFMVDKKDGWEIELRTQIQQQVTNVRSLTS